MRVVAALVWTLVSLLLSVAVQAQVARELTVVRDQGFIDIDLAITGTTKNPNGMLVVKAEGTSQGQVVGFYLELLPGWRASDANNSKLEVQWGQVRVRSIGPPSDRFVSLLSKEYALKEQYSSMAPFIEFPAVCLEGDPLRVGLGALRMKLFHEGKSEDSYAEVYVNLDFSKRRLEFHEKDPSYRGPVVRALRRGI